MRSMVIGANSFSGMYMCRYLREKGQPFIGTKLAAEKTEWEDGVQLEEMDLREAASVRQVLERYAPDCIFNFAEQNSVGLAWSDPRTTVEINVNGVLHLFEAVRAMAKRPVVVLMGAGEEYGRAGFGRMPTVEEENLHPSNIYAATKACQTMMAKIYHKAYGLHLIVARSFNAVGPGQTEQFAVSNFCRQVVLMERGQAPPVLHVGNPNIQRDFTDIRDLVRAYWLLGERGRAGAVYNVGRGRAVDIWTILRYLQKESALEIQISVDKERMRPIDIPKIEGSICRLHADTGWQPEISLEQSVDDMLQYWREELARQQGEGGRAGKR